MRVVLIEDVSNLGKAGDIATVKNGYARNYLLPQNLAVLATKEEIQRSESRARSFADRRAKLIANMTDLAQEIDGTTVSVLARVGPTGRLFGSVTTSTIADSINTLSEQTIDHRSVELETPIRELGEYDIRLRLAQDVFANIKVNVEPEGNIPDNVLAAIAAAKAKASENAIEEPLDEAGLEALLATEDSNDPDLASETKPDQTEVTTITEVDSSENVPPENTTSNDVGDTSIDEEENS
jgi:large subunit ribosomal protein L9